MRRAKKKNKGQQSPRASLAEMEAKLRAKKAKRLAKEALEGEQGQEAADAVEAHVERSPALARVVGGAERHGEILVELVPEADSSSAPPTAAIEAPADVPPAPGGLLVCDILRGRRAPNLPPVVGDLVRVEWSKGSMAPNPFVAEVLPRRNTLLRRNPLVAAKPQLLCANLDLALLVVSVEPNFSEGMVDRVLVSGHAQGIDVAIVLNKVDLVPEGTPERAKVEARLSVYERVGYQVVRASALTGEGVPELRELLGGKMSIFIGNSGVGKSHLLNKLGQGAIDVRVGEISAQLKLGKHTTTTTTLHRLPGEGMEEALLVDSPGAKRFGVWDVDAEELRDHFVEFLPFAQRCRFRNCKHLRDVGCAVVKAVEDGKIPRERHRSYAKIYSAMKKGMEGQKGTEHRTGGRTRGEPLEERADVMTWSEGTLIP